MGRTKIAIWLAVGVILCAGTTWAAGGTVIPGVTVPNTFGDGTPALAGQVNENFQTLAGAANSNMNQIGNLASQVSAIASGGVPASPVTVGTLRLPDDVSLPASSYSINFRFAGTSFPISPLQVSVPLVPEVDALIASWNQGSVLPTVSLEFGDSVLSLPEVFVSSLSVDNSSQTVTAALQLVNPGPVTLSDCSGTSVSISGNQASGCTQPVDIQSVMDVQALTGVTRAYQCEFSMYSSGSNRNNDPVRIVSGMFDSGDDVCLLGATANSTFSQATKVSVRYEETNPDPRQPSTLVPDKGLDLIGAYPLSYTRDSSGGLVVECGYESAVMTYGTGLGGSS